MEKLRVIKNYRRRRTEEAERDYISALPGIVGRDLDDQHDILLTGQGHLVPFIIDVCEETVRRWPKIVRRDGIG